MIRKNHKVTPDFNLLESECPKTNLIYSMKGDDSGLTSLESEFNFTESINGETPFYHIDKSCVEHLGNVSNDVYKAMVESLKILFKPEYRQYIAKFFSTEFVNDYPEFINYAIYTFENKHKALYGRFDLAFNSHTNKVEGVYEGNMDTPVTYYESIVLQHHLSKKIGKPESQYNEHHESLVKAIPNLLNGKDKRIAFLCDVDCTEDSVSTETLYHAFNEEGTHIPLFYDLWDLDFDFTEVRNPCFSIHESQLDAIFSMYPWECMVESFYDEGSNPLMCWELWADKTRFFEPAWRYFLSNKGIFAWLTFIQENLASSDDDARLFMLEHENAYKYLLKSYVDVVNPLRECVKKPLLGRQSANISHIKEGLENELSSGDFINSGWLYQEYCKPMRNVEGDAQIIMCTWMSPTDKANSLDMEMSGISIREFTSGIPTEKTERFVPHIIN